MAPLWKLLIPWHREDEVQRERIETTNRQVMQVTSTVELVARRAESLTALVKDVSLA